MKRIFVIVAVIVMAVGINMLIFGYTQRTQYTIPTTNWNIVTTNTGTKNFTLSLEPGDYRVTCTGGGEEPGNPPRLFIDNSTGGNLYILIPNSNSPTDFTITYADNYLFTLYYFLSINEVNVKVEKAIVSYTPYYIYPYYSVAALGALVFVVGLGVLVYDIVPSKKPRARKKS